MPELSLFVHLESAVVAGEGFSMIVAKSEQWPRASRSNGDAIAAVSARPVIESVRIAPDCEKARTLSTARDRQQRPDALQVSRATLAPRCG